MALDPIILDELATNRGVIDRPIKPPTGAEIPYVVRNPGGDWTNWLPGGEIQYGREDSMSCVSFAAINCIETQEFFLTGKRVNYSDRWLATVSGTMRNGNYLQSVADAIKEFGLVKEETWPTPAGYTWNQYMAQPNPIERKVLLAEGQLWLKTHKFEYGFIEVSRDNMLKYIKQAPLQIVIPGHSVMNFFSAQDVIRYFDSYSPFQKQTTRSALTDAARPVLTMKTMKFVNENNTIWLVGNKGKVGFTDMKALQTLQAIDDAPIENGSTEGIPKVGLFESGLTFHQ